MGKRFLIERNTNRDIRYWKKMKMMKDNQMKLNVIKELNLKEKLDQQITQYKGSKYRWPERKVRKELRKRYNKKIDWLSFYQSFIQLFSIMVSCPF
jgi:hypothetical protein